MANLDHANKLLEGVVSWNTWRNEYPDIKPDLERLIISPETCRETPLWNAQTSLIDLRGVNLYGANLQNSKFKSVGLSRANLEQADLHEARIEWTDLREANLRHADVSRGYLEKVNFQQADLDQAKLTEVRLDMVGLDQANLKQTDLTRANIVKVKMKGAQLQEADLSSAYLQEVDLTGANLEKSVLRKARLAKADLTKANLTGADLFSADLPGVTLTAACLEETDLEGADLRNADLRAADLRGSHVTDLKYNRWARYRGIRLDGCYGSPRFARFANDQEYIEEFRGEGRGLSYWFVYLPWLISSDCGRSILLWAGWSVILAMGFGYHYYTLGPEHFEIAHLPFSESTMIYHSLVTFTTLGFGDIVPKTTYATWWVLAEVLIGYIMLGGLIAIFANKLARRS
ncbi:MAG: pentapeptide repeat-containing protein [Deltaproteobacteria bacterium]|nr:pentapeptide repeat-containing protein [Deltaproteobacteria bacterium]